MDRTVKALRLRARELQVETCDLDTFDLLLMACSACCEQVDGGNKTCPPKVAAGIEAN